MTPDEQAIRDLIERWHRASVAGDVETVLGLMSDDVVFLVAGQPPIEGRSAFERGLRNLLAQHHIESSHEVLEVSVAGDLAYTLTRLTVTITPGAGGSANTRSGHALSILRRQADGRWCVVRDANLLGPAATR